MASSSDLEGEDVAPVVLAGKESLESLATRFEIPVTPKEDEWNDKWPSEGMGRGVS